jgi:hypothetical protein
VINTLSSGKYPAAMRSRNSRSLGLSRSQQAAHAVLLHFFQSVEHQQPRRLLQQEEHLAEGQNGLDARRTFQPHLQRFEKRFRVGLDVEGKDEDAGRRGERAVFGHVRVGRQPAGQDAEEPFRDGRLARPAHADQRQHAPPAAAPPLANVIELRSMLPIVGAQQGVSEVVGGHG